jgi:hypothetical protein
MIPSQEQLERYISGAEQSLTVQGEAAPEWVTWCAEQLRSAWQSAQRLQEIGRQVTEGLFGKR